MHTIKKTQYNFLFYIRAETEKGLSRKHIIEGLNASLARLQLDYVDIVFANKPEPNMPMEGEIDILDCTFCNFTFTVLPLQTLKLFAGFPRG